MNPPTWSTLLPATLSAIAALCSAATALIVARIQHRKSAVDAFFKVMDRFESAELRKCRYTVYSLDRSDFERWSDDEKQAVTTWSAHIDLVSSLILGKQINQRQTFELYGDVLIRSIYILSPYYESQMALRGTQYLIALRKLHNWLPAFWRKEIVKGAYAMSIGIPGNSKVQLHPATFLSDRAINQTKWRKPRKRSRIGFLVGKK